MMNIVYLLYLDNTLDKDEGNERIGLEFSLQSQQQQIAENKKKFDIPKSTGRTTTNLLNEGILAGQRIAKVSVITLISIGIAELITGFVSGSVVATADGIDSLSDAMISFIVLLGLRIAHRPADKKFHFGYHKVESFAAMMAAIGMIIIG